jgi:hypothetical protein
MNPGLRGGFADTSPIGSRPLPDRPNAMDAFPTLQVSGLAWKRASERRGGDRPKPFPSATATPPPSNPPPPPPRFAAERRPPPQDRAAATPHPAAPPAGGQRALLHRWAGAPHGPEGGRAPAAGQGGGPDEGEHEPPRHGRRRRRGRAGRMGLRLQVRTRTKSNPLPPLLLTQPSHI